MRSGRNIYPFYFENTFKKSLINFTPLSPTIPQKTKYLSNIFFRMTQLPTLPTVLDIFSHRHKGAAYKYKRKSKYIGQTRNQGGVSCPRQRQIENRRMAGRGRPRYILTKINK